MDSKADDPLEGFVAIAKGTLGKGLEALIQQVVSHSSIFTFGELLDVPAVAQMAAEKTPAGRLLELFAYGTCADVASAGAPALTPAQLRKLQMLSIVSACSRRKCISYVELQAALAPTGAVEVSALEDLLLDALYSNLIVGQMNQEQQQFDIVWSV